MPREDELASIQARLAWLRRFELVGGLLGFSAVVAWSVANGIVHINPRGPWEETFAEVGSALLLALMGGVISWFLTGLAFALLCSLWRAPVAMRLLYAQTKQRMDSPTLLRKSIRQRIAGMTIGAAVIACGVVVSFFVQGDDRIVALLIFLFYGGVLFLVSFSLLRSDVSEGSQFIDSKSYACPHCERTIRLEHIPDARHRTMSCPHCRRLITTGDRV